MVCPRPISSGQMPAETAVLWWNSHECPTALIEKNAETDAGGLHLLRQAAEKMRFSGLRLPPRTQGGAESIFSRIAGERLTAAA